MKLTETDITLQRCIFQAALHWARKNDKLLVQKIQQFSDRFEEGITEPIGNNERVLNYLKDRLEQGNGKFNREMPIDGTYSKYDTEDDALEAAADVSLYLASILLNDE